MTRNHLKTKMGETGSTFVPPAPNFENFTTFKEVKMKLK